MYIYIYISYIHICVYIYIYHISLSLSIYIYIYRQTAGTSRQGRRSDRDRWALPAQDICTTTTAFQASYNTFIYMYIYIYIYTNVHYIHIHIYIYHTFRRSFVYQKAQPSQHLLKPMFLTNKSPRATPGLHNKIPTYNIFARGWFAQTSICS